jgi:serine/threonine protein kinase
MPCPTPDELAAFLQGKGDPAVTDLVETCANCQQALAGLRPVRDPFEVTVRAAASEPPFTPAECREAVSALEHRPTARPPRRAAERAAGAARQPRKIGPYRLLQPLGKPSGQGVVCRALDERLGVERAVKVIRPDGLDPNAGERFLREIDILRDLGHPNIVQFYEADREGDEWFLAMELLDGMTVHELLERDRPLRVADACALIKQAADGLAHAHQRDIIHRDNKPTNLFVTRVGQVKVLDFGLARLCGPRGHAPMTEPGTVLGTYLYMAPEQAADATAVTAQADLYSLGRTLYHVLAGCLPPPFEAGPPIRQQRPDVPEGVAAVLDRLLKREPADRLTSAAALGDALAPFAVGGNLAELVRGGRGFAAAGDWPTLPQAQALPSLDAALDLLLWDASKHRHVSINEPQVLPLRAGQEFQIHVQLNRAAYVYVIWLTADGQAQPLYPWQPGTWQLVGPEIAVPTLLLPRPQAGQGYRAWKLDDLPGLETVILLAEPEGPRADVPGLFSEALGRAAPRAPLPPRERQGRGYWFSCRAAELMAHGRKGINLQAGPPSDPVFQVHSFLRDQLGLRFPLIQAVSFANVGKG